MKLYQFSGFSKPYFTPDSGLFRFSDRKKNSALGTAEVYCKASPAFWKLDLSAFACSKYMPILTGQGVNP